MPLYEYECTRCGKRFELIQKFSDPPTAVCVACGGPAHRLLSLPAIQFKGSGWYVTDYARQSAPADKSESSAESAAGADSNTPTAEKAGDKKSPASTPEPTD